MRNRAAPFFFAQTKGDRHMYYQRHSVTITATSTGGGASAYTPMLNGKLKSIRYSSGGTLSVAAIFSVTNEGTDESYYSKAVGSAGVTFRPRMATVTSAGVAIGHTTGSTMPVSECGELANERLKLTIATSTAASLTGTFLLGVG